MKVARAIARATFIPKFTAKNVKRGIDTHTSLAYNNGCLAEI